MKFLKWILAIVAIVIVGTIFFGGYGGLNMLMTLVAKPVAQAPAPVGTLILSLGSSNGISPARLAVGSGAISYLPADQLKSGAALTLQYNASSDARYAVFLGSPYVQGKTASSTSVSESMNVYRADLSNAPDYATKLAALQSATIVSRPSNADYFREFPAVAPSGAVLFSSLSAKSFAAAGKSLDSVPADSWNIMMVSASGTTTAITQGLRPKWVDATHFAFLKNDGIYLYDLDAKTEQRVWVSTALLTIVPGFDVSDDAQLVALSDPAAGTLVIIRALNWTGNILSEIAQVPVTATNLAFAPDDSYLAMIALTAGADATSAPVPTLRYYSVDALQFLSQRLSFDPKAITSIYLSDWR